MRVERGQKFKRQYRKLDQHAQDAFGVRLLLFAREPFHPVLKNHKLKGEYSGCRSINITGDVRAIFILDTGTICFIAIGTHHDLYGT